MGRLTCPDGKSEERDRDDLRDPDNGESAGEGREKKYEMSEEALGVGREVTLTRDVGLSRMRAIMLKSENGKTQR